MNIYWIKYEKDKQSFKVPEALGFNVLKLSNPEEIDKIIYDLINQDYKTLIISNEIASFSEDIIKKYNKSNQVNIIIASKKE